MPTNRRKKREAPSNMTLDEASKFWDEHSFVDYDDVHEAHFEVHLKKTKHYFAVEKDLAKQIHSLALQRGISAETLVNLWLKSKLAEAA
jgi:hypothetical protein